MSRLTFGPERTDVPRSGGSAILSAAGDPVLIYTDLAGTILADIQTPAAGAIPGSRMIVNTFSEWPQFLGTEDRQDPLFISVNNGPIRPIYSSFFNRFAEIVEDVSGLTLDQQSLQQLSDRLNALGDTPTTDDVIALILQYAGSPTAPAVPPDPATNLTNTVVGDTATLHYTPSATATSAIVEQDGSTISGAGNAPATGTYSIAGLSPGAYTFGVKMHNSMGTSIAVTTSVTIATPTAPTAPTNLVIVPNLGHPILTWDDDPAATAGHQVLLAGTLIKSLPRGVNTWTDDLGTRSGTNSYGVKGVNNVGAGAATTRSVVIPSTGGAITLSDKGTNTTSGDSAATGIASGAIAPTAGKVEVALVEQYRVSGSPGASIADTWGGSGGTAWASRATPLESVSGDYGPINVFSRLAPTGAFAGRTVTDGVLNSTATVTSATAAFSSADVGRLIAGTGIPAKTYVGVVNSATSIGLSSSPTANTPVSATASATSVSVTISGTIIAIRSTTTNEFWYGKLTSIELTNCTSDVPVQAPAVGSGSGSSVTASFGQTPDVLSIVITAINCLAASGTPTVPSGFTALTNTQPTGGTAMAVAYKIGSAPKDIVWTGVTGEGAVVTGIEFGQTTGGTVTDPTDQTVPPGPPTNYRVVAVTPQPDGTSLVTVGFDAIPDISGYGFNQFAGAHDFVPNPATNQLAWPAWPATSGVTTYQDPTPRAAGATVDFQMQIYNGAGPGPFAKTTVTIPSVITDPSDLGPKLGFSAEDLEPGVSDSWRNGQEVVNDMAALGNTTAEWFTLWCSPGASFCKHMIDAAAYYMAPGRALEGMKPAFTFPLGMSSLSSAAVASGAANAAIADVATHLQAAIDDPSNPIQAGQFSCRWGHEFPIAGIGPYSITNNAASMDSFSNAFGVSYDVFKGICASAIIVCCSYSTDYDISRALPFPTAAFPNKAYKCNAFGFDFYGDSSFPGAEKSGGGPYDPPANADAYWNALYYHNGSPSSPPPGSPAWQRKVGKDAGLLFAIDECGPMARFALPAAGCGDYPQFGTNMGVIHGGDDVLYINWFTAGATFEGQKQDHDWTDGHFNALLAALRAVYGD